MGKTHGHIIFPHIQKGKSFEEKLTKDHTLSKPGKGPKPNPLGKGRDDFFHFLLIFGEKIAKAVAETIPGTFIELATVGGLLHDLGKLFGYRINGIVCEMTDEGLLYEHTFLGERSVRFTPAVCLLLATARLHKQGESHSNSPVAINGKFALVVHIIVKINSCHAASLFIGRNSARL